MNRLNLVFLPLLGFLTSCSSKEPLLPNNPELKTMSLKSSAFVDGGAIPEKHSCDSLDVSPPLSWSGAPKGAKSLLVVCQDPDASFGAWTHWLVYNLSADCTSLPEALPKDYIQNMKGMERPIMQGRNDFGNGGWGGPCPPSGTHHYEFYIYALDNFPEVVPSSPRSDVLREIQGRVLAWGKLVGTYTHK